MTAAIQVRSLGKRYRIGEAQSRILLRDRIAHLLSAQGKLLQGSNGKRERQNIWALRDVSFDVQEGEVVGLIGRNGAGKSTLLKILSRVTQPTTGWAEVRGRMGSLLEVGTGFHPELTGRENVFLNGAILGMPKAEVERKFDEIVAFAEVEKFIDTPVKHYSSGMYVRLAFAVAAHLETDILFVDEVLAVGDFAFQKKCLGKMKEVAVHGRTVVFVSHSMQSISQLTNRCLLLEGGTVAFDGDTRTVISQYTATAEEDHGEAVYQASSGRVGAHVTSARVETSQPNGLHGWGQPIVFEFEIAVPEPCRGMCFSFQIINENAAAVCHFWLLDTEMAFGATAGIHRLRCEVPHLRLFMGSYTLATSLADRSVNSLLERLENICKFTIQMFNKHREQYDWRRGDCVYLEDGKWSVDVADSVGHLSENNGEFN